ncbi:TPA: hypothetical protein KUN82_003707 [Serratia marcescens]|uniref:hypothetical protein n=1 Tax=Pseudomonadota TaxID=1224 RepID=UPI00138AB5BB|nr:MULTISPECIES: hypothetical protein [Pseudomonadota]EMD1302577.1 hypothetical protein [Serratia marcescens]MBH2916822.1 hypothetical protein [Serratia marcescens]MBH3058504.1 hypothetical protein [Serratia marcescens]MDK1710106.1 hypothetical protein [Serratia marcescens]WRV58823.1 hypothetical protein VOT20_08095 [Serratia sp. K-M0260]
MRKLSADPRDAKSPLRGEGMTEFSILFGLLALLAGHFIAADLSDSEFARRPENQNYD